MLRAAVAAAAVARMGALLATYPPVTRRRAASLREKEAACARLLRALATS